MSEHTPGPWVNTGGTIESGTGWHIASAVNTAGGNSIANANRIVACVNACEGMDDPEAEIKSIRAEALKESMAQWNAAWDVTRNGRAASGESIRLYQDDPITHAIAANLEQWKREIERAAQKGA